MTNQNPSFYSSASSGASSGASSPSSTTSIDSLKEFTTYIPLRLSPSERALLNVLESTLHVSEYTDNVDVSSNRYGHTYGGHSYGGIRSNVGGGNKVKRILDGILEACHVATGLAVCGGYDHPSNLISLLENNVTSTRSSSSSSSRDIIGNGHGNGHGSKGSKKKKHRKGNVADDYDNTKSRKTAKQAAKAQKKKLKKLKKHKKKRQEEDITTDDDDNDYDDESTRTSTTTDNVIAPEKKEMERDAKTDDDDDEDEDNDDENNDPTTSDKANDDENNDPTTSDKANSKTKDIYADITSIASLTPQQNAKVFQHIFEIGRRNKVLNPSKMRATYGKLMHLLQDAQSPTIAQSLGFSLYKDMVMVKPFLESRGVSDLLDDERLVGATMFIHTRDQYGNSVERHVVEDKVRRKKELMEQLLNDYSTSPSMSSEDNEKGKSSSTTITITRAELELCIESITDAIAIVESNVAPVNRVIHLLESNFDQFNKEKGFSLELRGSGNSFSSSSSNRYGGYGFGAFGSSFMSRDSSGPTLSHSHQTQYTFVWQSLHLWREVQTNMHRLWVCADDDLLSTTTSYQLLNTGQGLNRVQSCPRVGRVMRSLLSKTQNAAGSNWVGLSVIHLGDRDVPNALVFIDKYTQIPRFLKPIADFVDSIPDICADGRIDAYMKDQFGSRRNLKMTVLADYFKHGFDGSGDDGGSCIDGRLTSSWNWTSRIAKKNYYHAFMLSGFQGFDGDFK